MSCGIMQSVAEDVSIGTSVATVPVTDADNDNGVSQAVILTIASESLQVLIILAYACVCVRACEGAQAYILCYN